MTERYAPAVLIGFTEALFAAAGFDAEKARITAELLLEADLLGHDTHGLALAAPYLDHARQGKMKVTGEPVVVRDRPAALTWDGDYLPGVWLTARAVDEAVDRALKLGVGCVVVRRSHHIACLATFLTRATSRNCLVVLSSSDPAVASIAPFGGRTAVMTPNPVAVGIPTDGDPILIDISASITTNGMTGRLHREGRKTAGQWMLDAAGTPSDDPAVLFTDPPGTILPTGGLDHGHKGYGMGLMIEALTQGLGGFGRADKPTGWGAAVSVQAYDPEAFGGLDACLRQTSWLRDACLASLPRPDVEAVRLPGQAGHARKRRAIAEGLALHPTIMPALRAEAAKLGVEFPASLAV